MKIRNVHERRLPRVASVGKLLDGLAAPDDPLWPWEKWPAMRFDRPLRPGADGGHGPVRYEIAEYERGKRIRFAPIKAPEGLYGYHEFEVVEQGNHAILRHVISGELRGLGHLKWDLFFGPLHNALLEDALDKAELAITGQVASSAQWSLWVRVLRSLVIGPNCLRGRSLAANRRPANDRSRLALARASADVGLKSKAVDAPEL